MPIDLKKLMTGLLLAAWPAARSAAAPSAGSMAGSALAVPLNNINSISDASAVQALAAVGKANPVMPIETLEFDVGGDDVTETNSDPTVPLVPVPATKKYKLSREYGGVAWAYGDANITEGVHLVEAVGFQGSIDRRVFRFDPELTPKEQLFTTLIGVDSALAEFTARITCFCHLAGGWRVFAVYNPPQVNDDDSEIIVPHVLMEYGWDGIIATRPREFGVYGEGARPSFAYQYESGALAGIYLLTELGWLYCLRDTFSWSVTHNPYLDRSFAILEDDLRPMAMDIDQLTGSVDKPFEYLLLVNPRTAEIRWMNVSDWDGTAGGDGSSMLPWKKFVAADAARDGIQDVCVNLRNGLELWVLTKGRELQRYDLEPYVDPQLIPSPDPEDNTPRSLGFITYKSAVAPSGTSTITVQLLDMWGRKTVRSGAKVEAIVCSGSLGEIRSAGDYALKAEAESISGVCGFTYRALLESGQETLLFRITSPG